MMTWQDFTTAINEKSYEIYQRATLDPAFGEAEMFEALDEINFFILDLYPDVDLNSVPKCDIQTAKDCVAVCEEFHIDKLLDGDRMAAYWKHDLDHYIVFLEQAVLWNQLEDIVYGKGV